MFSVGTAAQPIPWEDKGISGVCTTVGTGPGGNTVCANDGLYSTEDGNGNGTLDPGYGEGTGKLYFFPIGPDPNNPSGNGIWLDPSEAVKVVDCTDPSIPASQCPWRNNSRLDTEDVNGNGIMDRYLLYGVDVCTLPNASTNPACQPQDFRPSVQYVWPEGCAQTLPARPSVLPEGCPPSPAVTLTATTNTGLDDEADIYLIQGGEIRLGAFSLGVGVKFTF